MRSTCYRVGRFPQGAVPAGAKPWSAPLSHRMLGSGRSSLGRGRPRCRSHKSPHPGHHSYSVCGSIEKALEWLGKETLLGWLVSPEIHVDALVPST